MAGDRDTVGRLLTEDPRLRERAAPRPAGAYSCEAAALLIELGFDVNVRPRMAPLYEASDARQPGGDQAAADHGADPNVHDTEYDAPPAGWADHHGHGEKRSQLFEGLERPDAPTTVTAPWGEAKATTARSRS